MGNIEKRVVINSHNLNDEFYFLTLLEEACLCGLLSEAELENIRMQCMQVLAYKCERFNMYDSSSIKIEKAESIMNSIFYTLGLYLKSFSDPDNAARELKTISISEQHARGERIGHEKLFRAKKLYIRVQKNRLNTQNISYNSTLGEEGIGVFFRTYILEYEADDVPASIDYQLCLPSDNLVGVEYILSYLENLFLENEFCQNFSAENIQNLLSGYDKGYKDLLINIFEQVLTASLGCFFAERCLKELKLNEEDIRYLRQRLEGLDNDSLLHKLQEAAEAIIAELNIINPSLRRYIERSLTKIAENIENSLRLNTLDRVFTIANCSNPEPIIRYNSAEKMADEVYRRLVEEILSCRYSSDKLEIIAEKVKSFDDFEDILLDAQLEEAEVFSILDKLENVEIGVLINRHPFESEIQAVELPENEERLRLFLRNYCRQLPAERNERIAKIAKQFPEIDP